MKIAHEAPLSIFDNVQALTDYDYALVHLFEENSDYWCKFLEAKQRGREIILDNSIFELGTAWDGDRFAYWVERLQPDWYIVPDVLDSGQDTIDSFEAFIKKYPNLPGKRIAVAQGSTMIEWIDSYKYLSQHDKVDKIGISFNHPFYQDVDYGNKYLNMMAGRQGMLAFVLQNNIINTKKPHHILGCGLPQEYKAYSNFKYDWIESCDTSNPVIHGLKNIRYEEHGLNNKEPVKLFTLINDDITKYWPVIEYNIRRFREFANE